ncbi:hypothetical protein DCO48_20350 [Pseudomonas sp. SDI]|uniref:hypothetical protein n=1 Tax=Pseudomonas sp. SDI TaxID=2170734 RepID=UPI000DE680AF|nr:hypothetical protein [Pseudomonas sp. SDI]PWB30416.1 hypothetical protein DCO48_20350 [Pseudomonas sp. SDI]
MRPATFFAAPARPRLSGTTATTAIDPLPAIGAIASGLAYVTPATLQGRWMVRISVGALPTEREHVQRLWERLQAVVRQ